MLPFFPIGPIGLVTHVTACLITIFFRILALENGFYCTSVDFSWFGLNVQAFLQRGC